MDKKKLEIPGHRQMKVSGQFSKSQNAYNNKAGITE